MKGLSTLCRILAGMLLVVLGGLAFLGCGDTTIVQGGGGGSTQTLSPTIEFQQAVTPTPALISDAVVKPANTTTNPVQAVLPKLSFAAPSGQMFVVAPGVTPTVEVTITSGGQAVALANNKVEMQLTNNNTLLTSLKPVALPAGAVTLRLVTPVTIQAVQITAAGSRVIQQPLVVRRAGVTFAVIREASTVKTTYPLQLQLNMTPSGDGRWKLGSSTLVVKWIGGTGSDLLGLLIPNSATLSVKLFNSGSSTPVHTSSQTRAVQNGSLMFSGASQVPFTECEFDYTTN